MRLGVDKHICEVLLGFVKMAALKVRAIFRLICIESRLLFISILYLLLVQSDKRESKERTRGSASEGA